MEIDKRILEDYVERIYGYAVNKTYTDDEADELSSEILLAALQGLPNLRSRDSFEPWLWGVAANVTKRFRRTAGRQRAVYCYNVPTEMLEEAFSQEPNDELYDSLRQKISMLSNAYRQIIILYYYDGLSTKQISQRLGLPEGTVTWRLSEARKKLKKECTQMEESVLRPVKMSLGIYGSGNYNGDSIPFPSQYIDDGLSQNILYYCYENPCSVEELAKLTGVPAFYIEERIDNLVKREAVVEASKGKYQTDFIIWSDKHAIYCEENSEKALMPIMDKLISALDAIAKDSAGVDFYRADVAEKDLYYLYGAMAFQAMTPKYNKLPYPEIKKRYDGYNWSYSGHMETGKHKRTCIGTETCGDGREQKWYFVTYYGMKGVNRMGGMFSEYVKTLVDIFQTGTTTDEGYAANAIMKGFLVRNPDGSFKITMPVITRENKQKLCDIAEKHLAPLMPEYCEAVNRFVSGYRKLFPKHLDDECARSMYEIFRALFTTVIDYGQKTGRIAMPSDNYYCDAIIER